MFTRQSASTSRWCSLVLGCCACLNACGSKESPGTSSDPVADGGTTSSTAGTVSSSPDASEPSSSEPGQTEPTASTATEPTNSAGDTEPEGSVPVTGELPAVGPGTPEVLLADLALPGRVAFDADGIVLIDHRHYLGDEPDELVRVGKSGGEVEILATYPSIEGFVLTPELIWLNSYATHSVVAFGRTSGQLQVEIPLLDQTQSPTQMVDTGTHLLVALTPRLSVLEIDKATGAQREFWGSGAEGSATWLRQTNELVVLPANFKSNPATVIALPFDGTQPSLLAQAEGALRSVAIDGADVIFADSAAGVFRVPLTGGTPSLIASPPNPWGLLVEADTLYISSQPEYCDEQKRGAIYSVPVAGGEVQELATEQRCPSGLLIDADALYWVNNGDSTAQTDSTPFSIVPNGSLVKLAR